MLRRALERAGGNEQALRLERRLHRRAASELFATSAFTSELDQTDRAILLDAVSRRAVARGEAIYRSGDPANELWIVADGMVQLQTEDDERMRVRAYLLRGDFFGDEEVLRREPRSETAVASGAALLLGIAAEVARTVADRNPGLLAKLRRVAHAELDRQRDVIAPAALSETQHAFRDLYRLQIARSLLVIDLDSCVRCGHCSASCESLHGQARLVRHGDTIVTALGDRPRAPLMLPTSCQHCENPECMIDCPTGAIGRDPRGEVYIREALCTGCGACAKACPWDNIDMVARPVGSPYDAVAVKCDLCRGYRAPACVEACPTEAIVRIDPRQDLPEIARVLRPGGRASSATSWIGLGLTGGMRMWLGLGALVAATSLVLVELHARGVMRPERGAGLGLGIAALVAWLGLVAYAVPKRAIVWFARREQKGEVDKQPVRSRTRPQLMVHLALGLLALALVAGHGGARWAGEGGAAALGLTICAALGTATVLAYVFLPRRLSRVERRALLPEEIPVRQRELSDQLYAALSGKSELTKKLFQRIVVPYLRATFGALQLLASGRDLRGEEQRIHEQVERLLQGRGAERLAGFDGLVRLAVEIRALSLQRALTALLRIGLPAHIIAAAVTTALIALHLARVLGR
jgi:Fe-S-cluster-containing dehydrogenase component/CRP-like cAMP-binding protein